MVLELHHKFPAGLFCKGGELFVKDEKPQLLMGGTVQVDLPENIINAIDREIEADPKASAWLRKECGNCQNAIRTKFIECNYSAFDNVPDILGNGALGSREYVPCPKRGICDGEGIACKLPGGLTKKEVEVGKLVAAGLENKLIADRLGMSELTVPVHIKHICEKLGAFNRVQIATYFQDRNIVDIELQQGHKHYS